MGNTFWTDTRFALRMAFRQKTFTLVVILTLALGIGANTALFSIIRGVLLRPLPFPQADRLTLVFETNPRQRDRLGSVAPARFREWQERSTTFARLASYEFFSLNLTGTDRPESLTIGAAQSDLFSLLGLPPLLGRSFSPQDSLAGNDHVVLLSHHLWQRRFGADLAAVGRTLELDGEPHEIVGVLPAEFSEFSFPTTVDVWRPLTGVVWEAQRYGPLLVAGRLGPNVTLEQAQLEMNTIATELGKTMPGADGPMNARVLSLREALVGSHERTLWLGLGAVAFVLLIATANVANLFLARASGREQEMAIRAALGANRLRLLRQTLVESCVLAVAGGALGVLTAFWARDSLLALSPRALPRTEGIALDPSVLGFALGLSLLTGLLFGLPSALHVQGANLSEVLGRSGIRGAVRAGSRRVRSVLIVLEVAMAAVLLIGAGLLTRSLQQLSTVDPGFRAENVLTFRLSPSQSNYRGVAPRSGFYEKVLERLQVLPDVEYAGLSSTVPMTGITASFRVRIAGETYAQDQDIPLIPFRSVSEDLFTALGIPLLQGRRFEPADKSRADQVTIVNQALADRFWPGENPIGKQLGIEGPDGPWKTVVGVVGNVRQLNLEDELRPEMYVLYYTDAWPSVTYMIRTRSNPKALTPAVQSIVQAVDPDQPVYDIRTMEERLESTLARRHYARTLFGLFSGISLLLVVLGIYGVLAFSVTQRRRELGIRMALGALPTDLLRLVLRQGLKLAVAGIVLGLVGGFLLARTLSSLLYEVNTLDLQTYAFVALALVLTALAGSLMPAWRAVRVDPVEALRT